MMKVSMIPDHFTLISDSQEIDSVLSSIGQKNNDRFYHLFAEVLDGDYGRIYGIVDSVPYLNSNAWELSA
jgi:hypothetical protein